MQKLVYKYEFNNFIIHRFIRVFSYLLSIDDNMYIPVLVGVGGGKLVLKLVGVDWREW